MKHFTRPDHQRWRAHVQLALANGLSEALWLFITMRVALSLFAYLADLLFRFPPPCTWGNGPTRHTSGADFRLIGLWVRWDACWYDQIATLGYRRGDLSVNFFPLYPALQRLLGTLLGSDYVVAGLIVAALAYIAAINGLYQLISDDFATDIAQRTVLYLSIFPSAFFLFAPFTEALFLALTVWALLCARRSQWGLVAILACLAGLTRTQGAVLAFPLAWEMLRQWRTTRRRPLAYLAPLLAPGGFLAFILYGQFTTGLSALDTQRGPWGNHLSTPWSALAASLRHIIETGSTIELVNLSLLLLCSLALAIQGWRLPFSYVLLAAGQLLVILCHQSLVSPFAGATRYLLVIYPPFVLFALWGQRRLIHLGWLTCSLALLAVLLFAFLSGAFVA